MIKKLRIQLIAASMFSLFLVLAIVIGAASILNYRTVVTDADNILAILAANGGVFPGMGAPPDDHRGGPRYLSPELPYESRFFSVLLSEDGAVIFVDTGKIAAVDTATAMEYAASVLSDGHEQGFVQDYRYTVQTTSENGFRIIFLDCGRGLASFQSTLLTSGLVAALGLMAVFILILLLSKRIVKPVAESYEKQKRFITDAGHEIKTPLSIISADADVLGMELGENEWLQDIQQQIKRLSELTNDLVFLSRMEEEQNQFHMIDFPLSDVVRETAQSFQVLSKVQNKVFTSSIQPHLSLRGDEKSLRQLISILLDNALKYADAEGRIVLTLEKLGRSVQLSVFNTADSISRAQLELMFDRFYRTDQSRNSQTGGYGIGLSIAKAVVSAHKGKITASTQDEKSLVITVTLPA